MLRSAQLVNMPCCIKILILSLYVLVLRGAAAKDILHKMRVSDPLLTAVRRGTIYGDFQRMLKGTQLDDPVTGMHLSSAKAALNAAISAPDCNGPHCLVAPMPAQAQPQHHLNGFERMVHLKHTTVLHRPGTVAVDLDAFLQTSDASLTDSFGIPLPARPLEAAKIISPSIPSTATAIATATAAATAVATATTSADSEKPRAAPSTLRHELEAFLAASPLRIDSPSPAVQASAPTQPEEQQQQQEKRAKEREQEQQPLIIMEQEEVEERLTASSRHAVNAAAREVALERKRQKVHGERTAAAETKKAKKAAAATVRRRS